MAELSENPAGRLQTVDMELGRTIHARYTGFGGAAPGLGANVPAFLGQLSAFSPIRGSSSRSVLPQARSGMDHLLMRWKMGKPKSGVISTLPLAPEVMDKESTEFKSVPDGASSGVTESTNSPLFSSLDIASDIHARYGPSPGSVSDGNGQKIIRKRDGSSGPVLWSSGSKLMPSIGSIMRTPAVNNTVGSATDGPALPPLENSAISPSLDHPIVSPLTDKSSAATTLNADSILSPVAEKPSAAKESSSDLLQAEGSNSTATITHVSAVPMLQPGDKDGLVLRRSSVQSTVQRSFDAKPLASPPRESVFGVPVHGSAEPAPLSQATPEHPVLSPAQSHVRKTEAKTYVNGDSALSHHANTITGYVSAPVVHAGLEPRAEIQAPVHVQRSLASMGSSPDLRKDFATPIMQPPILRRPGRSAAAPLNVQTKLESGVSVGSGERPPYEQAELLTTHNSVVEAQSVSQAPWQLSMAEHQPAATIQRKLEKASSLQPASERLLLPAPLISLPERTMAPVSKMVQRRPNSWKINAAEVGFINSGGQLPVSSAATAFSQSGIDRTHRSPRLLTGMNAVSREHLVFRSPSNSNPQTGGPFLPLHRLSRRAATESSPSAFLVHADRAGNLIPSSGMIHRIQRVFTPDPVSGLALPGHHISSTEGMSGSLQRMSTSQNMAGAGTIETGPASLRTFPETSGNQPDMAQIASRVYDLLVVRLQNERQRRGF